MMLRVPINLLFTYEILCHMTRLMGLSLVVVIVVVFVVDNFMFTKNIRNITAWSYKKSISPSSSFSSHYIAVVAQFTNKKAWHYVNVNKTTATVLFLLSSRWNNSLCKYDNDEKEKRISVAVAAVEWCIININSFGAAAHCEQCKFSLCSLKRYKGMQQATINRDRSTISEQKSFKRQDVPFALSHAWVFLCVCKWKAKQEILCI